MKIKKTKQIGVLATVLLLLSGTCCPSDALTGPATVVDGDTLRVAGMRIRLLGIDAPESDQTCLREGVEVQCGAMAARMLATLIENRIVHCEKTKRDDFGRMVGRCISAGGDVAQWMVKEGWAIVDRYDAIEYAQEEGDARLRKKGIWSMWFVEPWAWRRAEPR